MIQIINKKFGDGETGRMAGRENMENGGWRGDCMRTTRKTRQKAVLHAEMGQLERLFTPEELHARVRSRLPGVGIATVYRFLKQEAGEGRVHRYRHGRKRVYSAHAKSDAHFICERCGRQKHLDLAAFDFGGAMKAEPGARACHFQLDVFGACEKCAGKMRGREPGRVLRKK